MRFYTKPHKFYCGIDLRLFRKFCGSQSTALMKDTVAKVLNVAEAEGPALDQLDLGGRAFDDTVGDPLVNVGEDRLLPATYGLHTRQQGLVARLLDLGDPCVQGTDRRPPMLALIERAARLLPTMPHGQLRPDLAGARQLLPLLGV
jgi:hypothetical protein